MILGFILCENEALEQPGQETYWKLSAANEFSPCCWLPHSWAAFACFLGGTSLKSYTLLRYQPEAMPESSHEAKTELDGWNWSNDLINTWPTEQLLVRICPKESFRFATGSKLSFGKNDHSLQLSQPPPEGKRTMQILTFSLVRWESELPYTVGGT